MTFLRSLWAIFTQSQCTGPDYVLNLSIQIPLFWWAGLPKPRQWKRQFVSTPIVSLNVSAVKSVHVFLTVSKCVQNACQKIFVPNCLHIYIPKSLTENKLRQIGRNIHTPHARMSMADLGGSRSPLIFRYMYILKWLHDKSYGMGGGGA